MCAVIPFFQIKNILFHAVKDAVAVLENHELKHGGQTC
jgi:hypothetical protein